MTTVQFRLVQADTPELLRSAREIFREYADSLQVDLCFQNFDDELAMLPGEYAPPGGALLLAYADDALAGCGAMRPLTDVDHANACEMKRLFVRRAFRRFGLGRVLAQALMDQRRERRLFGDAAGHAGRDGIRARAVRDAGLRGSGAVLLQPDSRRALPEGAAVAARAYRLRQAAGMADEETA